jgi:hypothetical protein
MKKFSSLIGLLSILLSIHAGAIELNADCEAALQGSIKAYHDIQKNLEDKVLTHDQYVEQLMTEVETVNLQAKVCSLAYPVAQKDEVIALFVAKYNEATKN